MANKQIQLTPRGLEKIKEELQYLKTVKRKEITEYMGRALEDGDLRESAAYDEARLQQSENEARIAQLENLVHNAVVVTPKKGDEGKVILGSSLTIEESKGEQIGINLVSTHEVDIFEHQISDESPLGKALMGHRVGDTVTVKAPLGKIDYKIIEVVNF